MGPHPKTSGDMLEVITNTRQRLLGGVLLFPTSPRSRNKTIVTIARFSWAYPVAPKVRPRSTSGLTQNLAPSLLMR